ncbi:FG-GAP repeat domain-containing protein [Archangium lansingense]|uniref:VCBS repeat-containing protein n=1 Tax=Archangium lansingense TaxID=2995310 RepID=A0ABT3ZXN3_9BACT|nr:VCBS repeat-containing protein [Archangium lansinium]MCY1074159.1 VCBS repeat-containing protein [Archangium lansinium]
MKRMTVRLVGTVLLGLATGCDNPNGLPELCSARGNAEGKVSITCFTRFSDGSFDDIPAITQTLAGTSGYVERWQYGESLHFTDFNGDGRVDLCSARGNAEGYVDVACHERKANGDFPGTATFNQTVTGATGWVDDWQYGEALHFTDFNGDGRVDLCSARGNTEGTLDVSCFHRTSGGGFPDEPSFQQTLTASTGWVERWRYGEALHFVDFNKDGRVDLCGARANDEGNLEVFCYQRDAEGRFPDTLSFQQFLGNRGWTNRWQYGEALHFTDFDTDGRVDLCGARGAGPGQLEAACFFQMSNGTMRGQADFRHAFLGATQWEGDWAYGEDLSFVEP